mgnify:CR=1 FL=1
MKSLRRWNRLNGSTHHKVLQRVLTMTKRDNLSRRLRCKALPLPAGGGDE